MVRPEGMMRSVEDYWNRGLMMADATMAGLKGTSTGGKQGTGGKGGFAGLLLALCIVLLPMPTLADQQADSRGDTATVVDDKAWAALLAGEAVAIMRHALAPGTGDPADLTLGDCSTQRNLSDQGREQARRIGERLRKRGLTSAQVLSSEWCRCRETAELLALGTVTPAPMLNSFFRDRSTADAQTTELRAAMTKWLTDKNGPKILVTHQVNISALTGEFTGSGDLLILSMKDNEVVVLERLEN